VRILDPILDRRQREDRLGVLGLIDLTFTGNLVLIVIFFPNGLMAALDRRRWWST